MGKGDSLEALVMEIMDGRRDGQLVEVSRQVGEALEHRSRESTVVQRWVLEVGDVTVREGELTLDMLDVVKGMTGRQWHELGFDALLGDHQVCRAIADAWLVHGPLKMDPAAATALTGGWTATELVDGLQVEQVDPTGADTSI